MSDPKKLTWDIYIPEDAWEQTGPREDPAARLHISCLRFTLAGMSMHVEAYAVRDEELTGWVSDVPEAVEFDLNEEIGAIYTLRNEDPPDSIIIRGREYILVAYPTG